MRSCLFNAQHTQTVKPHPPTPTPLPSSQPQTQTLPLTFFPLAADSWSSLLQLLSSLCVFTPHLSPSAFLSNLVLFSHPPPLLPLPRLTPLHPHHHLCSCIKVSQRSPASSKLTFPPFKSRSSCVELRKIKRHLPFHIYLFITVLPFPHAEQKCRA